MVSYHIDVEGKPSLCSTSACSFGDTTLHFSSLVEVKGIAEEIQSTFGASMLLGSKTSLTELFRTAMARQRTQRALLNEGSMLEQGFHHIVRASVPVPVLKALYRTRRNTEEDLQFYKSRGGNYALMVIGNDKEQRLISAPKTKDIALPMKDFNSWNLSLHINGPKTSYSCAACRRPNQARVSRCRNSGGTLTIRCAHCGQLNKCPYQWS